jgi:hypothetical protein
MNIINIILVLNLWNIMAEYIYIKKKVFRDGIVIRLRRDGISLNRDGFYNFCDRV